MNDAGISLTTVEWDGIARDLLMGISILAFLLNVYFVTCGWTRRRKTGNPHPFPKAAFITSACVASVVLCVVSGMISRAIYIAIRLGPSTATTATLWSTIAGYLANVAMSLPSIACGIIGGLGLTTNDAVVPSQITTEDIFGTKNRPTWKMSVMVLIGVIAVVKAVTEWRAYGIDVRLAVLAAGGNTETARHILQIGLVRGLCIAVDLAVVGACLIMPLIWLRARHKQLEAEIVQRKAKEAELEESNTKLSHAIEELRTAQRQLVESERMKALGEMAAGIAHDFNNSLMTIFGMTDFLVSDPDALKNRVETLKTLKNILGATKDAKEIVRRLKEFYKHKDEAPHEPMDVNQIVTSSVSLTRPRWQTEKQAQGHTVEVKTDLAKVLPVVMGNESQLREALINLILNAVDAIPAGGTITLRTSADTKWAMIEVIDTGVGMTEDARQRCLEPFFTTKKMGTGLGLSMVLGIIRRHNGEVEVKSEQGKGTTVILRFPVGIGTPVAGEAAEVSGVRFDKSLRVLVVDDDARVRETLKRFLEAGSHTVELAETGAEGLEKQRKGAFDLVIVDRAMPDMGGDKLAGMIKEKNPDMPIIMLTGFGGVLGETPSAPRNVDIILGKPISYRELQTAIAELMTKKTG